MIPLSNSLPYDILMKDVIVHECPFCRSSHVRLPITPDDIQSMYGGARKKMIVFPCCHGSVRIIDADRDYLLADRPIR
ncbi:hypothetical protein [Cohnella terricola]|uniref:Uncharacterized protein n=1 Tax=Cohnella terricola TaxID=1289167 RepID=A0A559JFS2_9BACL|nr:hypothetical protein [Cohnella terricola]TVX98716.1 hypothetical protein FPZ45_15570 [Cohnella terricola]